MGEHNIERIREVEKMGRIKGLERMDGVREVEKAIVEIR